MFQKIIRISPLSAPYNFSDLPPRKFRILANSVFWASTHATFTPKSLHIREKNPIFARELNLIMYIK